MLAIPNHAPYAYNIDKSEYGPLTVIEVECLDFANEPFTGYIRVHSALVSPVRGFFTRLREGKFPIFSMQCGPWESEDVPPRWFRLSNTVGYINKKRSGKTTPSHHASGLAFDLNPQLNPFIWEERNLLVPPYAVYNPAAPGTVTQEIAVLAREFGFLWGGDWLEKKDYMHFSWADCESLVEGLKPELPGASFA